MIKKIDINSFDFQDELENTKEFTKDVLKKYGQLLKNIFHCQMKQSLKKKTNTTLQKVD